MQSAIHITQATCYLALAMLVIAVVFLTTNVCINIDTDTLMNTATHVVQLASNFG
jgi:hypothetical protein